MRTSVGQKTQVPGHGYGCVSTVTGVTPESVRIGVVRSFAENSASATGHSAALARNPARTSRFV